MFLDVDYGDVARRARDISQCGTNIKKLANNQISDAYNASLTSWVGDAGDAYRKKLNDAQAKLKKRGANIERIGSEMEKTANTFKMIELKGISIFGS